MIEILNSSYISVLVEFLLTLFVILMQFQHVCQLLRGQVSVKVIFIRGGVTHQNIL